MKTFKYNSFLECDLMINFINILIINYRHYKHYKLE